MEAAFCEHSELILRTPFEGRAQFFDKWDFDFFHTSQSALPTALLKGEPRKTCLSLRERCQAVTEKVKQVSSDVLLRCLIHTTKCGNSNTTLRIPAEFWKYRTFRSVPKFAARSGSQRSIIGNSSEMWRVLTRTGAFHPTDSAEIRTWQDRIFW